MTAARSTTASLIAKVHVAKKQLGLSDEDYRAILKRVTGHSSSARCSAGQLSHLLAEFKRLGFAAKGGTSGFGQPHVRLIYALWKEAGIVGAIDNPTKEALRAFVERQTGVSAPEFCAPAEANKVAEALKAMVTRAKRKGA